MMKDKITAMRATLDAAESEAAKFDAGNKAAGTRLRAHMQTLKQNSQDVRNSVSELKNA